MPEEMPENAKRLLVVMYRLSKGAPGIQLHKKVIFAECERLRIFEMSNAEFADFHKRTLAEFGRSPN